MPYLFNSRSLALTKGKVAIAVTRLRRRFTNGASQEREQTLKMFRELKHRIVPVTQNPGGRGRKRYLGEHLRALKHEFSGKSELCYLHAELVVKIRRGIDQATTLERFFLLWEHENEHLTANLNSRWLISALDTFADYGSPVQRAVALMQVAFFNTIKLAETEHLVLGAPPAVDSLAGLASTPPVPLWDGMESYNVVRGDMLRNMLERMQRATRADLILTRIFETLLERAKASNNLLSRMMRGNRFFNSELRKYQPLPESAPDHA